MDEPHRADTLLDLALALDYQSEEFAILFIIAVFCSFYLHSSVVPGKALRWLHKAHCAYDVILRSLCAVPSTSNYELNVNDEADPVNDAPGRASNKLHVVN